LQQTIHDDTATESSTSSWDKVSYDALEEKPEAPKTTETAAEEALPESQEEKEATPAHETDESEVKEDLHKEDSPATKAVEEEKTDES
jgi:hypothetical protein